MENRPEYVGLWLGLSKIGVISALINTNLVSVPLTHSIQAADSKGVIYGSDYVNGWFCQIFNNITNLIYFLSCLNHNLVKMSNKQF